MKSFLFTLIMCLSTLLFMTSCTEESTPPTNNDPIKGYQLLEKMAGLWVGANTTPFGQFDFFPWDFRPISSSHVHAIYEGGTEQNIIISFFIGDYEGKKQIFCRNGGVLFGQYRATYFVLSEATESSTESNYRLVDAVGGESRSYLEVTFKQDSMIMNAYTSQGGTLPEPVLHMGFSGTKIFTGLSDAAAENYSFPKEESEVNLENAFDGLASINSATFFDIPTDPLPESAHENVSRLNINVTRNTATDNKLLRCYLSSEPIIDNQGNLVGNNINERVLRTFDILAAETGFEAAYVHTGIYHITVFWDADENFYPSSGDYVGLSQEVEVGPNNSNVVDVEVSFLIP